MFKVGVNIGLLRYAVALLVAMAVGNALYAFQAIKLTKNGKALADVHLPPNPTLTQQFAAKELMRYLHQISGAQFHISTTVNVRPAIVLSTNNANGNDVFGIDVKRNKIILSGNSDRALLYAVYQFLGRLGCRWLAPQLPFYNGTGEILPHVNNLEYHSDKPISQMAAMTYRKLDIDGGRSFTVENLKAIVDWMPKVFYNDLRVPLNMNGNNRVMWDNWRADLLPLLKERGIILEVGGHGYQNFLNAKMENGQLFKQHPDWFGRDSSCKYSSSERLVFNTENPEAADYFTNNIVSYIKTHPEIDIFNLWPPDVGRWSDCKEMLASGTPADRQARLANHVSEALKKINPGIRTELIAYSYTLQPPQKSALNKDILVDICPIDQSFEGQIYDAGQQNNANYVNAINNWNSSFIGSKGIYSYYRKYAWRSAPNVIPHYMQKDMQWYVKNNMQGISTYAEPGDWFTYEINHYILGHLAWNPNADVDQLISNFLKARYGDALSTVRHTYAMLEDVTRNYSSIPFTTLKTKGQTQQALDRVLNQLSALNELKSKGRDKVISNNLANLILMCTYLKYDLGVRLAIINAKPMPQIIEQIKEQVAFMQANLNKGVFILTGENDLARFTKKYGLTHQSLLD